MYSTYLVQRLLAPYKKEAKTPLQAMAKYGLSETGLPKEVSRMLSDICVFDYMGSSEYK